MTREGTDGRFDSAAACCVLPCLNTTRGGGVEVKLHGLSASALDGSDWSASRSGRFITGTRRMGRRVLLDVVHSVIL